MCFMCFYVFLFGFFLYSFIIVKMMFKTFILLVGFLLSTHVFCQVTPEQLTTVPDIKIPVSSTWASEFQSGTPISNSVDGNLSSIYHSRWGGLTVFPVILRYSFVNAKLIDYVTVVPRQSGSNGLFGIFQLWVTTSTLASYKYGEYDFKKSSATQTIFFSSSLIQPTEIQFRVKTGAGNFVSCAEIIFYKISAPYPTNTVEVAIGGNSYVTAGTVGSVNDAGFANWSSNQTVLSTYFKINTPGTLNLYLKATVIAQSVIQVKFASKVYNVNLVQRLIQSIGTIQNCPTGYLRVDIKGISKTGALFAAPSSILLLGQANSNMNYVTNNFSYYWGRRGPSDHMSFSLPTGKSNEWFYNELTVPVGFDPVGSYFMSNGFSNGYFGMQVNSLTQRRILFSVWSPYSTNDPSTIPPEYQVLLAQKGQNVTVNNFGGEGSGGQSYLLYNWTAGNTYKFLTRARPVENNYTEYTSYFLAPQFTDWKLIAKFLRPKTASYYTGAHSFLQNFNGNFGYQTRKVNINNQWVFTTNKEWIQLTKGTFTCDGTGSAKVRMDYTGGSGPSGFYLQNCGFFNENTPSYTSFTRSANGIAPSISFVN